jgi:hypothetical protein
MPNPVFLSVRGEAASPESLVRAIVESPAAEAPEVPEAPYLDLAERIVRTALVWQDRESGRIIDPCVHRETPTATARYIGALGALMLQGRCHDLADSCTRALEAVLSDLESRATNHGEFLVKESLFAFMALESRDAPERRRREQVFSACDPERAYARSRTNMPDAEQRHNFVTFALAGEAMKKHLHLADNKTFFRSYLEEQLERFDALGMYRDPGAPMVYDITARMNLELAAFYADWPLPCLERLREKLRSGAMCALLYQSPSGEMPFGGRSNQQNFVEASFALICEAEARRFKAEGDMLMAGVLRRAAARAVRSVTPYLTGEPIRFNKNRFPPETQHGRQLSYGFYGAYTLLIASQLAASGLLADETIPLAQTTPAETGTFLWTTTDAFHKVFASVQGSYLEIELCNEGNYDAVGWGRWHLLGVPPELPLSTPVSAYQTFVSVVPPSGSLTFGPGTAEGFAADLALKPGECRPCRAAVTADSVEFVIDWPFPAGVVSEKIRLMSATAEVEAVNHAGKEVRYRIPLLLTDGESRSVVREMEDGFELLYKDWIFSAAGEGVAKSRENQVKANRNGLYTPAVFTSDSGKIKLRLSVKKSG